MPGPTNEVSSTTPSRSGRPVCALRTYSEYAGTAPSSAATRAFGVAKLPLATARGFGGSAAKRAARDSGVTTCMAAILPPPVWRNASPIRQTASG